MEPLTVGLASLILLVSLLLVGLHVAFALTLASMCGLAAVLGPGPALHLMASTFSVYGSSYTLSVVPLFIAMGLLANEVEAGSQAYDALACWFGRLPGALGLSTIGGCTLFGAVTGSSIATAALFARISAPEMIRHGYDSRIAYGLVSASGAIGMMIPPSLLAIVYAAIAEVPVGAVLLAGVFPGLILAGCLGLAVLLIAALRPALIPTTGVRTSWREKLSAVRFLWSPLLAASLVIGGIYGGVFTATEAASIGAFVFLVIFVLRHGLSSVGRRKLSGVFVETARLTAVIFLLFCSAQLFARLMVVCGVSEHLVTISIGASPSPLSLAIASALLFLVLGCFVDSLSILAVTVPMLLPVAAATGTDAIWFGVVLILASQIGLITPPLGLNLYVVKGIAGPEIAVADVVRGALPFFVATLVALAIVIAAPDVSLMMLGERFGR
jgi:tripartite ATP-independent transporter DctM subunit